jgi:hypothetical protein
VERQSKRVFKVGNIKYKDYPRKVGGDISKSRGTNFCQKEENHDMHFDFQRQSWTRLLKKIRKWERLPAEDYDGWWPISHEDVTTWVADLPKLPPTREGEFVNGTIIVEKKSNDCKKQQI